VVCVSNSVERTPDAEGPPLEDVSVDHGRRDVVVTQELLDGADVVARFEEVGCEAVAKGVAGGDFGDSGCQGG